MRMHGYKMETVLLSTNGVMQFGCVQDSVSILKGFSILKSEKCEIIVNKEFCLCGTDQTDL